MKGTKKVSLGDFVA